MQKIFKKKLWKIIFSSSLIVITLSIFYGYLSYKSPFLKSLSINNQYDYIEPNNQKRFEFVIESEETVVAAYLKFSAYDPKLERLNFRLIDDKDNVLRSGLIGDLDDSMGNQNTIQFLFAENLNVSAGSKLVFSFEKLESNILIYEIELLCRESLWESVIGNK